jgi:putative transport protein
VLGPKLLGIDLEAACKDYEEARSAGKKESAGPHAWYRWGLRAYKCEQGGKAGRPARREAESMVPDARCLSCASRRDGKVMDATVRHRPAAE